MTLSQDPAVGSPSPITPGNAPGRLRRGLRKVGGAVLVVATVAAGYGITKQMPDTDTRERPFLRHGAVGQTVDARTFEVTVEEVRVAAVLGSGKARFATQGVWVIVRVRLAAVTKETSIRYAALYDSAGRSYLATDQVTQSVLEGRQLQPGIPIRFDVAFEVPSSSLDGLSVRFAEKADFARQRMQAMAQVDLGTTGEARWLDPAPATLAPVEVL